jgi:hypothetical protein
MDERPASGPDIENDVQKMRTCVKSMEHPSPHLHQSAFGFHNPEAFFLEPTQKPTRNQSDVGKLIDHEIPL